MAESLAKYRPRAAEPFLVETPELVEFPDGAGAVRFMFRDGQSIREFVGLLIQGRYDGEKVVVTNGTVAQLPSSDDSYILHAFAGGQGVRMDSVLSW